MRRVARRSWRVGPDEVLELGDGSQIGVVSRQSQINALAEGAVMCDRAGGVLTVLYGRHPTPLPGEFVTTELIVTWQDRAQAKPQPEEPVVLTDSSQLVHRDEPPDEEPEAEKSPNGAAETLQEA
jgi:hypothetical protein